MSALKRRLLLGFATLAVLSLLIGGGSYSSVSAERGVSVGVVEDDDAYLSVSSVGLDRCGNQSFATLRNQFSTDERLSDIEVRVTDTDGGLEAYVESAPSSLDPGESGSIEGKVTPTNGKEGEESLTLEIEGGGESVSASLTRTYPVACAESEPQNNSTSGTS